MSETTKRQVSQLGHLQRAEYLRDTVRDGGDFGVVEKPLTVFEKIYNQAWARKLLIVTLLALAWQGYASCMNVIDFTGQVKVPTNLSASLPIGLNWVAAFGIGLVNWLLWLGEVALTLPWIVYKGAMTISGGKCEPRPLLVPLFTVTLGALWDALISGELIFKGANTVRLLLQGYGTGLLLAAIMTTLEELMRGRSTLIITHRIATIHKVDKIVVLGEGTVVEQGRGDELVARGGRYAQLYHAAQLS